MVYQWKTPSLFNVPANVAGSELEKCADATGIIDPETVVKRAESPLNPIHPCFEWNDDVAAHNWRKHEASHMIRNLVTVVQTEDQKHEPITVRAFVNLSSEAGRGYKSIIKVLDSERDREYMLAKAKEELRNFSDKYASLSELDAVFDVIRRIA